MTVSQSKPTLKIDPQPSILKLKYCYAFHFVTLIGALLFFQVAFTTQEHKSLVGQQTKRALSLYTPFNQVINGT